MQHRRSRVYIFDLDGVIYRGDAVLPGATDAVARLRAAGARVFFLTNNSTRTREHYTQKLTRMGIPASCEEIMTSAYATALYFQEQGLCGTAAYVIGEEGILTELERVGVKVFTDGCHAHVQSVVVGLDRAFNYHKLCCAQQAIRSGARFIATNSDATFPVEGGRLIPGGGALVAAVRAATSVRPTVIGKPELYSLRKILQIAGVAPSEATLVGDRLDTDILAGNRMGMRTVLVLTGVTTLEECERAPTQARPDLVIPNLVHLPEIA